MYYTDIRTYEQLFICISGSEWYKSAQGGTNVRKVVNIGTKVHENAQSGEYRQKVAQSGEYRHKSTNRGAYGHKAVQMCIERCKRAQSGIKHKCAHPRTAPERAQNAIRYPNGYNRREKMNNIICSGNHPHHDFKNMELDYDTLYDLSEFFKVFGDSTRISIIAVLFKEGELCVCDIATALHATQSAISHQLRILRTAGLVKTRRDGKTIYYTLDDEHVEQIYQVGLTHILHRHGNS